MPDIREDQHPRLWALLFGGDKKKSLDALGILARIDVEWPIPWLVLLMAHKESAVSKAAFQAIRRRGRDAFPFLSLQRLSPQPKVRQLIMRLYAEFGELEDLTEVIPSLFDPFVDVRDEGRKAVTALMDRCLERFDSADADPEAIEEAMRLFADLSSVPQLNVRAVLVGSFLSLSAKNPTVFWELFPSLELKAKNAIEHEILAHPSLAVVELLYYGLVAEDSAVADRALVLIERLFNKDTIDFHVESVINLPEKRRPVALDLLGTKGLTGSIFETFMWVRRRLRMAFLQMFKEDLGERYVVYLKNLLEDANPQLVPTLIENFLTFREDLSLSRLRPLLESPSPIVCRAAIRYLHYRGTQEAVQHLLPLGSDEDPHTAKPAVKAISRITRDYVIGHYNDLSLNQRKAMTLTLQRIDPNFIASLAEALEGLDEEDRVHLTRILSEMGDHPDAQAALVELMGDEADPVRATAARGLGTIEMGNLSSDEIDRLISDPDPRVRANTIEALPTEEKAKRKDKIELAARSESPRERANAILALAEIGVEDYEIALMQMLRRPDSWMRASALWALSNLDLPHFMDKAYELCLDPEAHVRVHAIRAIGKKGEKNMAMRLTPWLSDPVSDVREAANEAIERRTAMDR